MKQITPDQMNSVKRKTRWVNTCFAVISLSLICLFLFVLAISAIMENANAIR